MKVLIGVLGRPPEQYQKVQWHFKGRWKTAGFPAEVIAQEENVDHFLVAIPDSLISWMDSTEKSSDPGDYLAFQENGRLLVQDIQANRTPTPFVLPSRFACMVEGRGLDFYHAALFHLVRWWTQQSFSRQEKVHFLLEASTGMNVFSLLTYRAVLDIVRVLAYTRDISFQAYTADAVNRNTREATLYVTEALDPVVPFLPQSEGDEEHLFEQIDRTTGSYREDPCFREWHRKLHQLWSVRDLWAFLGSVRHGLPLGIMTWLPPPDSVLEALRKLYGFFIKKTLKMRREDCPTYFWYRPIALTSLWRSYALGLLLAFEIHQRFAGIVQQWTRHKGATTEEMRTLVDCLYRFAPVLSTRYKNEVKSLCDAGRYATDSPVLLNKLLERPCEIKRKGKIGVNHRNFFAHAGFERCAVEVFRDPEGDIRFRYAEGARGTILKWLR